jgi:PAS domain S-box-containing protein
MTFEALGDAAPGVPAGYSGDRPLEVRWLHSILSSIHEGMLVLDSAGVVLQMNQAFTDLLGYGLGDAPIVPPYPWWPSEEEDAEERAAIWECLRNALAGVEGVAEFRYYDTLRRPVWIASADAAITGAAGDVVGVVRTFRDITRQKQSQMRRAAAVKISADLASAEDLETVLSVAQHGFEVLFNGGSTTQLDVDERLLFSGGLRITPDELTEGARIGLAGTTSADATNPRRGILLVPQTSATGCRIWVEFPKPRRIDTDEMIAADLFAQAFGLAVDRIVVAQLLADDRANLERAMESHRHIGQAVGILVERYRIAPAAAFDRLRQASQHRNLKLRDIAARVVRTGEDPEVA